MTTQAPSKSLSRRKRTDRPGYDAEWVERIKSRCDISPTGCWLWRGFKQHKGYGQTCYRNKNAFVHRRMFMIANGIKSLKTEKSVCHSCDVRHCCNPEHLWLGNAAANNMDSARKGRHRNGRKTHCKRGHPLSGKNLFVCSAGLRHCNTCSRIRQRIYSGWPKDLAHSSERVPAGYSREILR